MNIYKSLNEITEYIDKNLEKEISYEILAKMLGVNVYTMQRLFTILPELEYYHDGITDFLVAIY